MITTDLSTTVAATPEELFAYLSDMNNMSAWGEGVSSSELIRGDGAKPGAVYRCQVGLPFLGFSGEYELIQVEPSSLMRARCTTDSLEFEDTYTLEALPEGGTRLRIVDRLQLLGLLSVGEMLFTPAVHLQISAELRNIQKVFARS